jgi:hypothetical protein
MTTSNVLHAIAELVHALRQEWDRPGIYSACHALAATQPLDQVAHAAIDAAMDKTARTPAVIATRARHWQPTLRGNDPPPVAHVIQDRPRPDAARQGAANARQALATARARVDDEPKSDPPPRS